MVLSWVCGLVVVAVLLRAAFKPDEEGGGAFSIVRQKVHALAARAPAPYIAREGDRWDTVASAHGVALADLLVENDATKESPLHAGQAIRLPTPARVDAAAVAHSADASAGAAHPATYPSSPVEEWTLEREGIKVHPPERRERANMRSK